MPIRKKPDLTLPKGKRSSKKQKLSMRARLRELYKKEWENERNRAANLSLLKAVAMFTGAVLYFKTIGEALFIS